MQDAILAAHPGTRKTYRGSSLVGVPLRKTGSMPSRVGADIVNTEALSRGVHQRRKLWGVPGVLVQDCHGGADVRLHAGEQVNLRPLALVAGHAVLHVEPADEAGPAEAGAVHGEVVFDGRQGQAAPADQCRDRRRW